MAWYLLPLANQCSGEGGVALKLLLTWLMNGVDGKGSAKLIPKLVLFVSEM